MIFDTASGRTCDIKLQVCQWFLSEYCAGFHVSLVRVTLPNSKTFPELFKEPKLFFPGHFCNPVTTKLSEAAAVNNQGVSKQMHISV